MIIRTDGGHEAPPVAHERSLLLGSSQGALWLTDPFIGNGGTVTRVRPDCWERDMFRRRIRVSAAAASALVLMLAACTSAASPALSTHARSPASTAGDRSSTAASPTNPDPGFDFVYDTVTSGFTDGHVWLAHRGVARALPGHGYGLVNPIPSRDGNSLLVKRLPTAGDPNGGGIAIVDLTGKVIKAIPHTPTCFPGGWAKQRLIVIACGQGIDASSWHVITIRTDGTQRRDIAPDDPGDPPSVSPDGTSVAYANGATLFTMPATGGKPKQIATDTETATWSPDGKLLAYATNVSHVLHLLNADGSEDHTITTLDWSGDLSMTFSPNGKTLLLSGSSDTPEGFAVIGVGGRHVRHLTTPLSGGDAQRLP